QKKMLAAHSENRVQIGRLSNFIPETLKNMRMVRVYGCRRFMEKRYDDSLVKSYRAINVTNIYESIYSPVIKVTQAVITAVMMILAATGGRMQAFFGISVGTAVAMISYVGKIFTPIESIGMEIQTVQSAVAGSRRVEEFMNGQEREIPTEMVTDDDMDREKPVEARDLDFSYDGKRTVLSGLSFEADPGVPVTVVGKTGAGKSTLFKLILGLYEPTGGSLMVFGKEASKIADSCKRRIFGVVAQSFRAVPGTVADQIRAGDPSISDGEIKRAASEVGISETVEDLPEGYETPYSDDLFSEGQKQLISIARASAAEPRIMLLDEMTANLDSETEEKVMEAIQKASAGRTVISISHRYSAWRKSEGRTVEIKDLSGQNV
ncbi:MAG: ABC transporter ATP-binding protein, partial [Oscillospiraceae bacterium]